jgi:hypothetical protein
VTHDGQLCVLQPYAELGNYFEYARDELVIEWLVKLKILRNVLSALLHLNGAELVVKDLTFKKVMVGKEGNGFLKVRTSELLRGN